MSIAPIFQKNLPDSIKDKIRAKIRREFLMTCCESEGNNLGQPYSNMVKVAIRKADRNRTPWFLTEILLENKEFEKYLESVVDHMFEQSIIVDVPIRSRTVIVIDVEHEEPDCEYCGSEDIYFLAKD